MFSFWFNDEGTDSVSVVTRAGCAHQTDAKSLTKCVPRPLFLWSKLVSEVSVRGRCVPRKCFTLRPAVGQTWGPLSAIGMFIFMTSVPEEGDALFQLPGNEFFFSSFFPQSDVTDFTCKYPANIVTYLLKVHITFPLYWPGFVSEYWITVRSLSL